MLKRKLHFFSLTILLAMTFLVACATKNESQLTINDADIEYTTDDKEVGVNPDGKTVFFETVGDYKYIYPSKEHLQLNAKNSGKKDSERIYTMSSLYDEYYDD